LSNAALLPKCRVFRHNAVILPFLQILQQFFVFNQQMLWF